MPSPRHPSVRSTCTPRTPRPSQPQVPCSLRSLLGDAMRGLSVLFGSTFYGSVPPYEVFEKLVRDLAAMSLVGLGSLDCAEVIDRAVVGSVATATPDAPDQRIFSADAGLPPLAFELVGGGDRTARAIVARLDDPMTLGAVRSRAPAGARGHTRRPPPGSACGLPGCRHLRWGARRRRHVLAAAGRRGLHRHVGRGTARFRGVRLRVAGVASRPDREQDHGPASRAVGRSDRGRGRGRRGMRGRVPLHRLRTIPDPSSPQCPERHTKGGRMSVSITETELQDWLSSRVLAYGKVEEGSFTPTPRSPSWAWTPCTR